MNGVTRKGFLLAVLLLLLNGCALLPLGGDDNGQPDEEALAQDPVARAALQFRQDQRAPASDSLTTSRARAQMAEIAPKQLTLGMTPTSVRTLWGQPQEVENAGDSTTGNQRWIYLNGLSGNWGTSDTRIVYFENNRVVGWENHR